MNDSMIVLDRVTKVYPGGNGPAVNELNLEVTEGETVVLVGPSGCGKTTTLKMINRIIEPTFGRIMVAGRSIQDLPAHELRRGIGYVIQQVGLFPHRTIAENIATVPRLLGWPPAQIGSRIDELIEVMGLDSAMKTRYPSELSGGQRQRVGVARALAADPPILLMDEPFGAVDPIVRRRLQYELVELQARLRKTIVFVTHDVDEAIGLGDRIAIMNMGGIIEQYGPPEEVLREPMNEFVADFLGADRGLKRLSLISVSDLDLPRGPVVDATADREEAKSVMAEYGVDWVGILDGERLQGWAWGDDLPSGRPVGEVTTRDFWVRIDGGMSLRRALDAIVNSRHNVAVVYDDDRYVGMVFVEDLSRTLLQ